MARVSCPNCGTEFDLANHDNVMLNAFHDNTDRVIGTLTPAKINNNNCKGENTMVSNEINFKSMSAAEKAEVLKAMGFNPFDLMKDNPINSDSELVQETFANGYIKNQKTHRRWVTAQFLRLMEFYKGPKSWDSWTDNMDRRYSFDYQFTMMIEELRVISVLEQSDRECFEERVQFFSKELIVKILNEYIAMAEKWLKGYPTKKCKGVPYIRLNGRNIFISDINRKVIQNMKQVVYKINMAANYAQVYSLVEMLYKSEYFVRLPYRTQKMRQWVDSFKGAGAYETMKNLVTYSGLKLKSYETDELLSRDASLEYLKKLTKECAEPRYGTDFFKLLALLRESMKACDFNFSEVINK